MLERLVDFSLRWRVAVFAMVAMVTALGLRSALALPIDAVPDVTNVQVQVLAAAPALSPLEVERSITAPVERAMAGLPGMTEIRSVTRFGLSAVTVVFEDDTDLLHARQLVGERLARARSEIPSGVGSPELGPMSTGLGEVLQFEVRGEGYSAMELREVLDWVVAWELRSVPGVVEVNAAGGEARTYEVAVDPARMSALGVDFSQLYAALEDDGQSTGGGSIVRAGQQMLVRGDARFRTLDDLGDVIVRAEPGAAPLRIRDLGVVRYAPLLRQGGSTRDGRGEAVVGIVMMLVGANGRSVVADVRERLDALAPSLPPGVSVEVFYDRAELVDSTIETVLENLGLGALVVVAVLFLLLGSIRGGLIVALAIPFSLLVAFIGMHALGLSGNLMSLGAVDFGIVVDASIIVVENALSRLVAAAHGRDRPMTYEEASRVVLRSTLEVRRAATFGEAILVVVYIPILTLSGVEGRMFQPMAITVLFALMGAFIASLTFVPVLAATLLRGASAHAEPPLVRLLRRVYEPLLERTLRAPKLVMALALGLVLVSALIATRMGADFVPRLEEGSIAVQIQRLPSVSLEESLAGAGRVEAALLEFPEVTTVVCKTGRPEVATDPMGIESTDCMVMLRHASGDRDQNALAELMSERLRTEAPGLALSFSQPIELRVAELLSGSRADVAIRVHGDDLAELSRLSAQVQRVVAGVAGARDVRGEALTGMPTLDVELERERAGRLGVPARRVLDAIASVGGRTTGEVYEGERRFPVQVRLAEHARQSAEQLTLLPVRSVEGSPPVTLGEVARVGLRDGPAVIARESGRRRTTVEVNVRGRDLASFVVEARERVRTEVGLPPGYSIRWGGRFEQLEAASVRLAWMLPAALGLVLLLLYAAFGRWLPALVIFLDVPFAAVGGVLALAARGLPLSISAAVGFIALSGIAVLNGLVLLATVERNLEQGALPLVAVRDGARARLRAVLTTAAVAALGFLPMALASGAGAEVQRPLATVVVGGVVSSMILTLLVLPTLYAWLLGRNTPSSKSE